MPQVKSPINQNVKCNVGPTSLAHLPANWAPLAREEVNKQLPFFPSCPLHPVLPHVFQPLGDGRLPVANGWLFPQGSWPGKSWEIVSAEPGMACFFIAGVGLLVFICAGLGVTGWWHLSLDPANHCWNCWPCKGWHPSQPCCPCCTGRHGGIERASRIGEQVRAKAHGFFVGANGCPSRLAPFWASNCFAGLST